MNNTVRKFIPATIATVTFALLMACSNNPTKPAATAVDPAKNDSTKKAVSKTLVEATGASIAAFHKNLSALDKVGKLMGGPGGAGTTIEVGLQSLGGGKSGAPAGGVKANFGAGGKPGGLRGGVGGAVKALLKRSAHPLSKRGTLAKTAAFLSPVPDTTWFVYSDSGNGTIYSLRTYGDNTVDNPYTAKDSTIYKWPYDELHPVIKYLSSHYNYADGSEYWNLQLDADGDGILNGAAPGKTVRLRKISITTNRDTTWKNYSVTDHGNTTIYDSLGDGAPLSYADTTFIKGKVTAWDRTYDGDGDGFINTAASGDAKVKFDSYSLGDDGTGNYFAAAYGPGPDKDYNQWDDNIYYPFSNWTIGPNGDTTSWSSTEDFDGDGILNGFAAGKTVQLKHSWWGKVGDTLSKSFFYTDHGSITKYDSLGDGNMMWSVDSSFIGGKVTWWHKVYDGDGDGFAYTAAAGQVVKVKEDTYSFDPTTGQSTYSFNINGVGADKDYSKWEDNEQYPSYSFTLNAKQDTIDKSTYDDADGDGFYFNPAKGSVNKVKESNFYSNQDGYKTYKDSVVKYLNDISTGDDDQVTFYSAAVAYDDGSTSLITTSAKNGKDAFGEKDTVEVKEFYSYTHYIAQGADDHTGDQDSTVRVTWMIPNKLNTNDDDQVVYWSSKTYYKKTQPTLYSSEVFTAKVPVLSGQDPAVGTMVTEERYSASADHDVSKYYKWEEFDTTKGTSSWHETQTFANGDSTSEDGSQLSKGIGTYAKMLDKDTRNSGWYNSNTNEFKDTTIYLNAKGLDPAKDISWGTYKDEDGTGDYYAKQVLANGDTSLSRTIKKKLGEDLFEITEASGAETNTYKTHKDTTIWEQADSTTKTVFSSVSHDDGSYTVLQTSLSLATSAIIATGDFTFWPDGSGKGSSIDYVNGQAQAPVDLKFDPDGTTYVNGVKVLSDVEQAAAAKASANGGSAERLSSAGH